MTPKNSAILIRIDTPEPIRLFGGPGLFENKAIDDINAFDAGAIYNQLDPNGAWVSAVPPVRQLVGGMAEALDFTLSGVPAIPQTFVDERAAEGFRIYFGDVEFDADLQQVGDAWWIWSGIIRKASAADSSNTTSITLTAETTCASRSRATLRTWCNANFRQDHPTDGFCRQIGRNGLNRTVKWPN